MATEAKEVYRVSTSETRNVSVDFTDMLDTGELLTGTPTVATASGLTIASEQVNVSTLTINGRSVAAGLAVQFTVAPTSVGLYSIEITCGTDASQTVEGVVKVDAYKAKY